MLSIQDVKDQLPDVKVNDNGTIHKAILRGRQLDFPKVHYGPNYQYSFEVSWQTLTHCINENKPVII